MSDETRDVGAKPGDSPGEPRRAFLVVAALGLSAFVIVYPFTTVHYPPITDLPFHAAEASILRHYFDPSFHFRQQFTVHPLEVPYLSMYVVGALCALVFPIAVAAKIMAVSMLALVPIGLAVFFHGMKKSPLLGLLGLAFIWCTDTQWGFFNFMGAIGLFAMALGFALLVVDSPTAKRRAGLALSLVLLFFTHVYRFPFAIVGVLLAGLLVYPSTRRFGPLLWPLVPGLFLFSIWLAVRPRGMGISFSQIGFQAERFGQIGRHLFGSYFPVEGAPMLPEGALERRIALRMLAVGVITVGALVALFFGEGRAKKQSEESTRWAVGVTALPILVALGLFVGYLILPFQAGRWFYVYPREIVAAAVMLLGAVPDLPKAFWPRVAFLTLFAFLSVPMTKFVSNRFREFEKATADFRDVVRAMPKAPKLFYLMYWLGDSNKRISPFLHLPAWIQAEKGGALGFHFVQWNHSPIRYRSGADAVPPPLPDGFEWTPQYFNVSEHGKWFDTFLVRHQLDPHELFDSDPSIRLVLHRGTWWMYRRSGAALPAIH